MTTDIDCYEIALPMKPLDVKAFANNVKAFPALDEFIEEDEDIQRKIGYKMTRNPQNLIEEIKDIKANALSENI